MSELKKHFNTMEAAELAGFRSAMMVDYLCRSGIIIPSARGAPGRGRSRLYLFGDIVLLRALCRLLKSGLPVSRLKAALRKLKRNFKGLDPTRTLQRYLITDGVSVYLDDNPNCLTNLNSDGQMEFAFIVDIVHARDDVIRNARARSTKYYV